jgi:hypothetical protein
VIATAPDLRLNADGVYVREIGSITESNPRAGSRPYLAGAHQFLALGALPDMLTLSACSRPGRRRVRSRYRRALMAGDLSPADGG